MPPMDERLNGTALTYDLNGNLLTSGTNIYTWDARNHLSTLTGSGTLPTTASFIYDAVDRRFEKTINQQTTAFLFDGWNPVQELMPSGLGQYAPTANMLTGLSIDEFFQRTDVNGTQSFITDTLGSTLALTNAAGSISTSYTYEPFGNVSINPSATNTNPYQFTGRENDGSVTGARSCPRGSSNLRWGGHVAERTCRDGFGNEHRGTAE